MKPFLFFLLLLVLSVPALRGQDTLILNDGSELHIKILEVMNDSISYKKTSNKDGGMNSIGLGQIFMIIYHGGKRESFDRNLTHTDGVKISSARPESREELSPKPSLTHEGFEVRYIESKTNCKRRKNDSVTTMSAVIDAYYNGLLLTRLAFNAWQQSGFTEYAYMSNGRGMLRKSSFTITAQSIAIDHILFEKYEKSEGNGFGWCLSPGFFSTSGVPCSIKLMMEKDIDAKYYAGDAVSMRLQDCSTVEKKILSASLQWLETNFGNSQNILDNRGSKK
jgi:hypothetical protein